MKLFGNHRNKFTYCSDMQLKEALFANKQEAFDYVFEQYAPLLESTVKSAFKVNEEEAKRTLKKRCTELQDYLLADDRAKLKLYEPDSIPFEAWLASVSRSFFKQTFCNENTALVDSYRKGDPAIVFQRYKFDFEQKIRLNGKKDTDVIEKDAEDLSQNLYIHLFKDNCHKLNTYNPAKESFDAWFRVVLRNFSFDQHEKEQRKEREVIDSGGFVRMDEQDTSPAWERLIQDTDDEEKRELLEELRELLQSLEPPRYREILMALYFEGEGKEDVARRYQVTMDNFYNISKRALDRFKKICKEHGLG